MAGPKLSAPAAVSWKKALMTESNSITAWSVVETKMMRVPSEFSAGWS